MTEPHPGIRSFAVFAFLVYALAALPLVSLFAVNQYFRNVVFRLASHYRAALVNPRTVHVGDSITAGGGHWSFLLKSIPFDSINLAGNGYTTRQIANQVHKALTYQPEVVVIMAGANDILDENYNEQDVVDDYASISESFAGKKSQCLVTLPVKMRDPRRSQAVERLNRRLKNDLPGMGCLVIDLNPDLAPNDVLLDRFTGDGVHLTHDAYKVWADKLRPLLPQ